MNISGAKDEARNSIISQDYENVTSESEHNITDQQNSDYQYEDATVIVSHPNELEFPIEVSKFKLRNSKYRNILITSYTVILILVIFIIWGGLIIPLVIGVIKTKLPEDARKYVSMLNSSLKENLQYLPENCVVNQSVMSNVSINCSKPYVFNCTLCVPICGLWHPYGDNYYLVYRIVTNIAGLSDLIVTGVGLLILIKVPNIFKFPRICYIFMFINGFIFSVLFAAAALPGPFYFFCSQRYEDHAIVARTPSLHVSFVGAIEHFTYASFNMWFTAASANIFLGTYFPTQAITKTRKGKLITFIIENIICWGIPAILVIAYLAQHSYYTFIRLPQIGAPVVNHVVAFVYLVLPILVAVGTALTLIALTIYRLLILRAKLMTGSDKPKFKSHEVRIIIFVVLFWLNVVVLLFEVSFRLPKEDIIQYELEDYWSCITLKENPLLLLPYNQSIVDDIVCDSTRYKSHESPIFTTIGDLLYGIWAVLLCVILTNKECRETCKKSMTSLYKGLKTLTIKPKAIIIRNDIGTI